MKTNKAILFVHGILGGPDFFDFLREAVPDDRHIYSVTLEGHGGSPRDFSKARMARWKAQITAKMEELTQRYDDVAIAAHSMGTLFAIREAVEKRASRLFLLNPPLKLHLSRRLFTTPAKVLLGKIDDPVTAAAKAAYSISDSNNPLDYAGWLPRYIELFAEIRRTRPIVEAIPVATQVFLSGRDEMVSPSAAKYFGHCQTAVTTLMPASGHYYYTSSDKALLCQSLQKLLS